MKDEMAEIRNRRDLVSASNLASWSVVGIIIPILGLLIAIYAKQKLNYVVETKTNWEEIEKVHTKAGAGIILSILSLLFWLFISWIISEGSIV